MFGQRFADLICWAEPFALVLVCIGWGALLAVFIEHPANAASAADVGAEETERADLTARPSPGDH